MTLHWPLQMIWTNDVFNWEFNGWKQRSCTFPIHNYVLLLPDNSTDFEDSTLWTKKGAVQQVHADVTAENQWNLDHHGIRRSSCKTRQVTMVSVEIISPKEAPGLSEMFQPSSLKLNCVTANSVEEYWRILDLIIELTSIFKQYSPRNTLRITAALSFLKEAYTWCYQVRPLEFSFL